VTLLDGQPQTTLGGTDAEALIEEARQRQRRRWWSVAIVVLLVAVAGGIAIYVASPTRKPPTRSGTGGPPQVSVAPSPTQAAAYLHVNWESVTGASGGLWLLGSYQCPNGTCLAIMRSTDGGRTFERVPVPRVTENTNATLQFANRDDGYLYVESSGHSSESHLYWTGNGGKVWRLLRFASPLASAVVTTNGRAYALIGEGECYKYFCRYLALASSAVTSETWTTTPLPSQAASNWNEVHLAAYGSKVWLITVKGGGGDAHVLVSKDGGRSFRTLASTGMSGLECSANAASATTLWGFCHTGSGGGFAVRSTDGGLDFANIGAPVNSVVSALSYAPISGTEAVDSGQADSQIAYNSSERAEVWVTRDGGQHFSAVLRAQQNAGLFVAVASSSTWLALDYPGVGTGVAFWRTSDGGRSWDKVKPPRLKVKR
jgi:photosystem II stability/assembly factor-like uncharacterized protein